MFTTAAIALGGNVGNVPEVFHRALAQLDHLTGVQLVSRSRNFETHPMGDQAGGAYTNAVALLQTTFTPSQLLSQIHQIETEFGRERGVTWGPRTLDIDILSFGCAVLTQNQLGSPLPVEATSPVQHRPLDSYHGTLIVPHPGSWYRRFVLDPWCDVAPQWKHPVLDESVREMRERLRVRPLPIAINGGNAELVSNLERSFNTAGISSQLEICQTEDAAIVLDFDGSAASIPRSVLLTNSPGGFRLAVTVLRAALDEPIPLSS